METVADLVEAGDGADKLSSVLPELQDSLGSFLDEQKEKPSELGMIDNDILALANQESDEMEENSVDGANIASELSFLEGAEAKEATEDDDDPGLSFLVGGSKIEVDNEELAFLEEQELSDVESYSDESEASNEEDEEDSDEEEEGDEEEENDNDEEKPDKPDEVEDGVFGQVSFYDEEPESSNPAGLPKVKKTKPKGKKVKRKRKLNEDEGSSKPPKKKRKRKTKKKKKEEGDDEEEDDDKVPMGGTTQMRRRNIRTIMSEKDLDKDMLSAQNEELERQKRLMELKKTLLRENAAAAAPTVSSATTTTVKMASASTGTSTPKEKDSQLKSLLQVAEEEAEKEAEIKGRKHLDKDIVKIKKEAKETSPPSDVITLSSDTEDSDDLDDDDSDDVVMVPSDEEEEDDEENEDVNNGGAHIDDTLNLPDPDGRVKVNIGHPAEEPDIFLAPQIAQAIKPHQIGGVRFLYDNLLESLDRFHSTPGFGCILAHSMGLGKTIQLISFIDIFLRCVGGKRVLCIVPINTLQNWLAEFNYWLPEKEKLHPDDNLTQHRTFNLFIINDSMKTTAARAAVIHKWKETGGALIMGYEMFRLLSSKKVVPTKTKSRAKKPAPPEVIDVEEEDKNKSLMIDIHSTLVDPGPDLVMCDEGHRIKNSSAAISQALKNIKTRRRVVLTGYPLQNNLMEYWCMVDFVRPSFLGTKTEFSNMFERPIMNGQCMDSTAQDKKVMRHRSYVLHNLLEGFVQRRGHTVLQLALPPKSEHVFLIRLSPIQRKIYCEFMNAISESGLCSWANNNPLKAFAVCCKIWNHPDVLYDVVTQRNVDKDNDLDIGETGESGANKNKKGMSKSASSASIASTTSNAPSINPSASTTSLASLNPSASTTSLTSLASESSSDKNPITYDWAETLMKNYIAGVMDNGGKMALMNSLIEESLAVGDKVLVFSQSLLTLNKIEEFMSKLRVPRPEINENWAKNKTYFRLDGSTSAQDREKLINQFNDPESPAWMFLLSTKAGCLGINLIGANRVIVVDASWNPCHDCQAVCRVYRFGQVKNTFVYRLVTDNTLEKRIYDRQINKQGMSDRIIDDMNPENKLTRRQVENLLDFEDQDFPELDFSNAESRYGADPVLISVLKKQGNWLTKQPFTHESLLIDRKELRLSKREKRLAKEGYARDKRMNITYTRPSYAAFYPQQGGLPNRLPLNSRYNYAQFRRGPIVRPIASVRPMISAPAQNAGDKIKQFGGQPLRPGVTIHQVITTTEIVLPGTNTGTQAGPVNKITAGQKILVIKTPKGVYIRTNDGKMFAVRSKTGSALTDLAGTGSSVVTTATTTLTSAGSNQVFITPGITMSSAASGKKPPIIIVSNKKGVPLSMARGGSIIKTLPYGQTSKLTSLRPNIFKAAGVKGTDSTTTTSSTSTKSSTNIGEKPVSLASLIASDSDEKESDGKDGETEKKTSEGGTQSDRSKMPVIVLPSLAVRTPRPPQQINQSSTVASTSPGGGTVVIMPTKPVVSMGTKRPSKSTKSKKSKAKDSASTGTGANAEDGKKGAVSLLTPSSSVTSTTSSMGTATEAQSGSNSGSTSEAQGAPTSHSLPTSGTSGQAQQQQQSSNFPDLNSMWQNNFGSGPSMATSTSSSPLNSGGVTTASRSAGFGNRMLNMNSGQSMMPSQGGDRMGAANQAISSDMQNQNGGYNNQQQGNNSNNNNNQGYNNNMNNSYMSGNMPPYGMSGPMMGSMQNPMSSYMPGMHPGFMPNSGGPFGQTMAPNMPSPNQSQQGPSNPLMFNSTPTPPQSQFSSPPLNNFGMNSTPNQQSGPPPFGSSSSGNGTFHNPANQGPFPFTPSFGGPSQSSFMPQQQVGDQQGFSHQSGNPPTSSSSTGLFNMEGSGASSPFAAQPQNQTQQPLQPQQQQNHLQSSSSSSGSPAFQQNRNLGGMDTSGNDNSPFSLTLLGSEPTALSVPTPPPSKPSRSKSKSSKNSSVSRDNPSTNKFPTNSKQQGGNSNSIPPPTSSPQKTSSTPDVNKSFMDISNNRPTSNKSHGSSNSAGGGGLNFSPSTDMSSGTNAGLPFSNLGSGLLNSVSKPSSVGQSSFGGSLSADLGSGNSVLSSTPLNIPSFGGDGGLGSSAFRAHSSSVSAAPGLPAAPQPFRLDGAGGISGSGLNYNSSMSAFSSPSASVAGAYAGTNPFGSYGTGYPASSSLPFSPPMMAPQSMMGYPQTPLGYPSMSSLMMGPPAPPAPPAMGGSMWPMMAPAMMGGGYGYPAHPTGMGFTPGLDGQGFGALGQGPPDN